LTRIGGYHPLPDGFLRDPACVVVGADLTQSIAQVGQGLNQFEGESRNFKVGITSTQTLKKFGIIAALIRGSVIETVSLFWVMLGYFIPIYPNISQSIGDMLTL
jgi:hypothetical protein